MSAPSLSLDRFRKGQQDIYKLLAETPDGLNVYEISKAVGIVPSTVRIILKDNVLFYVDRWVPARNKVPSKIWCAAEMKRYDDCPFPEPK
jgi:hypothetical protein